MTTVRGLSNLYCSTCRDTWIHERNVCRKCGTPNHSSGTAPVPRARPYGYSTMKASQYDAAAEQAACRRRARQARHNLQIQRGASKP